MRPIHGIVIIDKSTIRVACQRCVDEKEPCGGKLIPKALDAIRSNISLILGGRPCANCIRRLRAANITKAPEQFCISAEIDQDPEAYPLPGRRRKAGQKRQASGKAEVEIKGRMRDGMTMKR